MSYYYPTMTERYSVRIGSERFAGTIFVEPLIWHWFREIAADRHMPLSHLMDEIDRDYRLIIDRHGKERVITLSSAVRLYVTEYIAIRAAEPRSSRSRSRPK
jgi:predicted DNA-binding ribbon-helix-helix protein